MGPLEKTQEISESGNIIVDADTVQKMLWFLWEQMETLLIGLMTCWYQIKIYEVGLFCCLFLGIN